MIVQDGKCEWWADGIHCFVAKWIPYYRDGKLIDPPPDGYPPSEKVCACGATVSRAVAPEGGQRETPGLPPKRGDVWRHRTGGDELHVVRQATVLGDKPCWVFGIGRLHDDFKGSTTFYESAFTDGTLIFVRSAPSDQPAVPARMEEAAWCPSCQHAAHREYECVSSVIQRGRTRSCRCSTGTACVNLTCASMGRAVHVAHAEGVLPEGYTAETHCLYCFHLPHLGECFAPKPTPADLPDKKARKRAHEILGKALFVCCAGQNKPERPCDGWVCLSLQAELEAHASHIREVEERYAVERNAVLSLHSEVNRVANERDEARASLERSELELSRLRAAFDDQGLKIDILSKSADAATASADKAEAERDALRALDVLATKCPIHIHGPGGYCGVATGLRSDQMVCIDRVRAALSSGKAGA